MKKTLGLILKPGTMRNNFYALVFLTFIGQCSLFSQVTVTIDSEVKYCVSTFKSCIKIWDINTLSLVNELRLSDAGNAEISWDNKYLVTASGKVYSFPEMTLLADLMINAKTVSRLGQSSKMIFYLKNKPFELWDIEQKMKLKEFNYNKEFYDPVIASSLDGKFLAIGSFQEKNVCVWNVNTGVLEAKVKIGDKGAKAIAFANDSKKLVIAGWNHTNIVNTDTWSLISSFDFYPWTVNYSCEFISYSKDDQYLVVNSSGNNYIILNATSGEKEYTVEGDKQGVTNEAVLSSDGELIFCGVKDMSNANLISLTDRKLLTVFNCSLTLTDEEIETQRRNKENAEARKKEEQENIIKEKARRASLTEEQRDKEDGLEKCDFCKGLGYIFVKVEDKKNIENPYWYDYLNSAQNSNIIVPDGATICPHCNGYKKFRVKKK